MADEDRSFARRTASSNRTRLQGGDDERRDAPDVDAVEAETDAGENAAAASRRAEADRFQGSKTRKAAKDIISRRG